jgi:GAF domain-containing protein
LSFLLGLNDQLRDIAEPTSIMAKVAEALGRFLGIDRVGYGEIDGQYLIFYEVRNEMVFINAVVHGVRDYEHLLELRTSAAKND